MNLYDFIESCKEDGLTADEALHEWNKAQAEAEVYFFEEYYNSPDTLHGWYQQDVIDLQRMER